MSDRDFRKSDAVSFKSERGVEEGYISSIKGTRAIVVVNDGREYRVSLKSLTYRADLAPKRVRTRNEDARIGFKVGDEVSFKDSKGRKHLGHIARMGPKYARVNVGEKQWRAAYTALTHQQDETSGVLNRQRLGEIAQEADRLLKDHRLHDWRFTFDNAERRGGLCHHRKREISLSEGFALAAKSTEVTDTILHEIAHAMVGPRHGHDRVWRNKALEIGCSARVTHDTEFSESPWLMVCETCNWNMPRKKRRRGLHCKKCGKPVSFQRNDFNANSSVSE